MNQATPVFAALAFVATGLLSPAASAHDEVFVGPAPFAGVVAVGPVLVSLGSPVMYAPPPPVMYAPPPRVVYAPPPPVTTVVYRPVYREPVYHRPVVVYEPVGCSHPSHHDEWRGDRDHDHDHDGYRRDDQKKDHGHGYAYGHGKNKYKDKDKGAKHRR